MRYPCRLTLMWMFARRFESTFLGLHNLKPAFGSNTKKLRCRGPALGGSTYGHGNKGQKVRSGNGIPNGFEGGQTPIYRRLPKIGARNPNAKQYLTVNLNTIQNLIDTGRISASTPITPATFYGIGWRNIKDGVKILARGAGELRDPINVLATQFTGRAIKAIEEKGGNAFAIYSPCVTLKAMIRPDKFLRPPKFAAPTSQSDIRYYCSEKWNGYLHPDNINKVKAMVPEWKDRWVVFTPKPFHMLQSLSSSQQKMNCDNDAVLDSPIETSQINLNP